MSHGECLHTEPTVPAAVGAPENSQGRPTVSANTQNRLYLLLSELQKIAKDVPR